MADNTLAPPMTDDPEELRRWREELCSFINGDQGSLGSTPSSTPFIADTPTMPTGQAATGGFGSIYLNWDTATYTGHSHTEIWYSETDDDGTANPIGTTPTNSYQHVLSSPDGTKLYYYWFRHVNLNGEAGPLTLSSVSASPDLTALYSLQQLVGNLGYDQFAPGVVPIRLVDPLPNLPDADYPTGSVVFLTSDGKLYRNVSNVWTAEIAAVDITGQLTDAQIEAAAITAEKLASGAVDWATHVSGTGKPANNADVTDYADYRVSNSQTANDVTTIANPQGGNYSGSGSTNVGAIKITLPQSWSSTMMKFEVDVFIYDYSKSFTLKVGGYNYVNGSWHRTFTQLIGNTEANNRVRFGHDGSKCCIIIGETTTNWPYAKIAIKNFQAGYQGYDISNWESGWNISIVSSLSGITFTSDFPDALLDAKSVLNQGALATLSEVTASEVAANAIYAGAIQANAVGATAIAANAITADKISANAVTTDKIDANAITSGKIAAGAVIADKIGSNEVITQAANIGNAVITSAKIGNGEIKTANIADANITNAKIGTAAVTTAKIADANITTAKIADANITNAKIASAAITEAKIGTAAVTNAKIGDLAVGTVKIQDQAVTFPSFLDTATATANTATWTTFNTLTWTASGAPTSVIAEWRISISGNGSDTLQIRLLHNLSTTLSTYSVTINGSSTFDDADSGTLLDQVTATTGSNTLTWQYRTLNGAGNTISAQANILTIETKK